MDSASKSKATLVISDLAMLCSIIIKVLMESVKAKQIGPLAKKGCFEMPLMLEIVRVFAWNKALQTVYCSREHLCTIDSRKCVKTGLLKGFTPCIASFDDEGAREPAGSPHFCYQHPAGSPHQQAPCRLL